MRRTLGAVGALALLAVGVVACSSPSVSDAQLGFTVTEGLLLVSAADPTVGTVILSSTAGNCRAFQEGAAFSQIVPSDFLTFALESLAPDLSLLPLSAGTYAIEIPSPTGPLDAGLYAASTEYETTSCDTLSATGANSGDLTLDPFNTDGGAGSTATFTVIFGYNRFRGAYPLTTCVVPVDGGTIDAGACLPPGYH